ncbi:MAG: cupin domain-containing protein [Pirellulales bacterium]|nr:cupin domain-containing protein [Pirellulales bacterium]
MAAITIPAENRQLTDPAEMNAFLGQFGICYERWPLEDRVSPDAASEEILAAYEPEIRQLMERGGYVTADVVNITPETPNLQVLLDKFNKEHIHTEDEVRFILKGKGLFHIHPANGPVFAITIAAGDMINVPRGTQHWFDLCEEKTIRAIRLFQDQTGWTPHYIESGVHASYAPLCWGPNYLPPAGIRMDAIRTDTVRV